MLRSELGPDFASAAVAASLAQESRRIALPLHAGAAPARAFRVAFDEVRREVADFIAGGSSISAGTLSAEGLARRMALQRIAPVRQNAPIQGTDPQQQREFIASIAPWARKAAAELGVEPELVAAHAALESGWGQRPLRDAGGGDTHNLFGVKAGSRWSGEVARAATTEVESGVVLGRHEIFRSYGSADEAFRDYAQLLREHPRFAGVLNAGADAAAFGKGLVQGRYATDPQYAQKIEQVTQQVRQVGLPALRGGH